MFTLRSIEAFGKSKHFPRDLKAIFRIIRAKLLRGEIVAFSPKKVLYFCFDLRTRMQTERKGDRGKMEGKKDRGDVKREYVRESDVKRHLYDNNGL